MFDWGSGICLWSDSNETKEKFGDYPIEDLGKLPISAKLREELEHLIVEHDEAMNWGNPGGDLLWSEQEVADFKKRATAATNSLCVSLARTLRLSLKCDFFF